MSENTSISGTKISAGLLEAILAASPDMMVIFDDSYHLVNLLNPNPSQLPLPANEMIGKTLEEIITLPEAREYFQQQLRKTRKERKSLHFDICFPTQNNTYYFEIYTALLPNEQVIAFMRDITDYTLRKIKTEKLQLFLSRVLESINIPISIKDMNTERYIFWSKQSSIFGRSAEEMVGQTEAGIMSEENALQTQEFDRKLAQEKKSYRGIEKFILNDGQEHMLMITKHLFTEEDMNWLVCSALDITSIQKQQEEIKSITQKLMLALNITKHSLWMYDIKEKVFVTDSWQLKGIHKDSLAWDLKIPFIEFCNAIHPDDQERVVKEFENLIEGKVYRIRFTLRADFRRNGQYK